MYVSRGGETQGATTPDFYVLLRDPFDGPWANSLALRLNDDLGFFLSRESSHNQFTLNQTFSALVDTAEKILELTLLAPFGHWYPPVEDPFFLGVNSDIDVSTPQPIHALSPGWG
jgi:hypothetical protein